MNSDSAHLTTLDLRSRAGSDRTAGLAEKVVAQYLPLHSRLLLLDSPPFAAGGLRIGEQLIARAVRAQSRFGRALRVRHGMLMALQNSLRVRAVQFKALRPAALQALPSRSAQLNRRSSKALFAKNAARLVAAPWPKKPSLPIAMRRSLVLPLSPGALSSGAQARKNSIIPSRQSRSRLDKISGRLSRSSVALWMPFPARPLSLRFSRSDLTDRLTSSDIQKPLALSRPGGGLIQKQTRIDDSVSAPIPRPLRRPSGSHTTAFLLRIQRRGGAVHVPDAAKVDAEALHADLRRGGPGAMVDPDTRRLLKGHLRFDPVMARLHRSPAAAGAARQLQADAFTIGHDVFFGAEQPDAATREGLGLLAHELTHVGQQMGMTGSRMRFFTPHGGDEMEQEAQQTARRVVDSLPPVGPLFQSASPLRPSLHYALPAQAQNFETEPPPSLRVASSHQPAPSTKRANVHAVMERVYELMKREAALGLWRK